MSEERWNEMIGRVRERYHAPTETPREEMWRAIEAGMRAGGPLAEASADGGGEVAAGGGDVVDLAAERARRSPARPMMWAAAAAAVLVLGIGIGRGTAPVVVEAPPVAARDAGSGLAMAAREHLGRTESLLTMVRADARTGALDPATSRWARELLAETRLLLDAQTGGDPAMDELLQDLELVLVQIVGVTELGAGGDPRASTELDLALRGLEEGEVLPRIQAALPASMAGA